MKSTRGKETVSGDATSTAPLDLQTSSQAEQQSTQALMDALCGPLPSMGMGKTNGNSRGGGASAAVAATRGGGSSSSAPSASRAQQSKRPRHEPRDDMERYLLLRHGPLTQLNDLCPDESDSRSSSDEGRSAEAADADDDADDKKANEERRRVERLRALQQLPAACLPVYAELSESGVASADRSFAAVIVTRALQSVQRWA